MTLPARPSDPVYSASISTGFVAQVYSKLSPVYDLIFGRILQPGRVAAVARMDASRPSDVLEVGVGTGLNAPLYPPTLRVVGVDLSSEMLERARERVARERLHHVRLLQMDAAHLTFPDHSFDIVYAPYTVSVVPDPIQTAREMRRVCKPGGTILILNHFRSADPLMAGIERVISPLTVHAGFRSDLELAGLLARADLKATSIESVNVPPLWHLVTCINN
jgi:phosphatidylethanolamine/phosphatidyl-N-methylethanolamine N-methyltransferase